MPLCPIFYTEKLTYKLYFNHYDITTLFTVYDSLNILYQEIPEILYFLTEEKNLKKKLKGFKDVAH